MKMNRVQCGRLMACFTVLVAAVALTPLWADNGKRQRGQGKYARLSALWWQWALSQPAMDIGGTNTNPILDTTGEFAAVGQEDGIGPANKFFFLAGTFGFDATRTVTVPEGKHLFFPVINFEGDNAVEPPTDFSVPELRALAKTNIDGVDSAFATLDGEPLDIFRTKSPTFSYTVPDENSIYDYFGLVGPQFEGRIKPAVSDGFWVHIPPLPAGSYVLNFGGGNSSIGFSLDVTYFLTVE